MIIEVANRTKEVNEYYFSKKLQEIDNMRALGCDVINLGIGSPDQMPDDKVINTLIESCRGEDNHAYQNYKGIPALRQAYANWYNKYYNVDLDSSNEIQPLTGSKEGILLLSLAFLNKGDQVLIPNPGYPTYSSATLLCEAEIINYNLSETNDWQPDFEQLETMDLSKVKIMWTNYPNMPTGAHASLETYQRLVDFGRKHKILIANDNPYSFIRNNNPISILEIQGAKDVCIELNSLSKSHNMAGWRMGMIAGDKDIVSTVLKVKSNMDSGIFKPLQLAAIDALALDTQWYETLNHEYDQRKELASQIFDALGVSYDNKYGGMFLWGRIPNQWESGEELSDHILNTAHIFITPGFIFGSNGHKYIRISLCAKQSVLTTALTRIKNNSTK